MATITTPERDIVRAHSHDDFLDCLLDREPPCQRCGGAIDYRKQDSWSSYAQASSRGHFVGGAFCFTCARDFIAWMNAPREAHIAAIEQAMS